MASQTFLELTNTLRDRLNEVHLTATNWDTVVGFDQFSKDAINYAYSDILNAEMEWPFLHVKSTVQTIPGIQVYNVTTSNEFVIKEIDWDSFFIALNTIVLAISGEAATIGSTLIVAPSDTNWNSDLGVIRVSDSLTFTPVDRDPNTLEYTIKNGSYYFNVADVGTAILLSYQTAVASTINVNTSQHLWYMDYDVWRQTRLQIDLNAYTKSSYGTPNWVFKSQQYGELGFSPVPDKIYIIDFECWLDTPDLVNTTDIPAIPERFFQVILDGAAKYCYEFREDPQTAAVADKRFQAGIQRMRTELINRQSTMNAGMYWRKRGFNNTLNTA